MNNVNLDSTRDEISLDYTKERVNFLSFRPRGRWLDLIMSFAKSGADYARLTGIKATSDVRDKNIIAGIKGRLKSIGGEVNVVLRKDLEGNIYLVRGDYLEKKDVPYVEKML